MSSDTIVELTSESPGPTIVLNSASEPEADSDINTLPEAHPSVDRSLPEVEDDSTLDSVAQEAESVNESTEASNESQSENTAVYSTLHSTRASTPDTLTGEVIDTPQDSPHTHPDQDFHPEEDDHLSKSELNPAFIEPESESQVPLEKKDHEVEEQAEEQVEEQVQTAEDTVEEPVIEVPDTEEPDNIEEGDAFEEAESEQISFQTALESHHDNEDEHLESDRAQSIDQPEVEVQDIPEVDEEPTEVIEVGESPILSEEEEVEAEVEREVEIEVEVEPEGEVEVEIEVDTEVEVEVEVEPEVELEVQSETSEIEEPENSQENTTSQDLPRDEEQTNTFQTPTQNIETIVEGETEQDRKDTEDSAEEIHHLSDTELEDKSEEGDLTLEQLSIADIHTQVEDISPDSPSLEDEQILRNLALRSKQPSVVEESEEPALVESSETVQHCDTPDIPLSQSPEFDTPSDSAVALQTLEEQQPVQDTHSTSENTSNIGSERTIDITPDPLTMALQERSSIASQLSDALALFTSFDDAVKTLVTRLQSTENNILTKSSSEPEGEGESQEIPQASSAPFNVPYKRNSHFHGRFTMLSQLFGMWRPQQKCRIIVVGLGGVGKTQLVVEFVHRARLVSPATPVFWFGPDNIRSKDASSSLGMHLEDWLRGGHSPGTLLVVDVGDRSDVFGSSPDLAEQLRAFQGTVVLLTRNARHGMLFAKPHEIYQVTELELEACMNVMYDNLESYAHDASTEKEIQDVAKALICSPLAIIQVAKLINSTEMTVSQFLKMYTTSIDFKLRLFGRIDNYSDPDHDMSIIGRGVFDLRSFRKIYPEQSRMLYQLYYLGGTSIPCVLVETNDPLDKILFMLIIKAHFIISEDKDNQTFSIHPLVYLAMRKSLGGERSIMDESDVVEERKWYDEAILAFSKHYPDANCENRSWWKECFTQLITGYTLKHDDIRIAIARIYHRESAFFKRKGIFSEALKMASLAKGVLPDPVPSDCLVIVQDQVALLDFLAKYREVHEMLRGLTMELGHPGGLWKKSMQAKLEVADCANRYDSAIEMFRNVRTAGEAANADKLDLANASDDLGMALMQKGKYKEAAAECKKALSERSSRLGSLHTDTLSSCHNMAEIFMKDGKFEDAIRYIQEALRGRESVLGPEHPETIHSRVLRARIQISKATTAIELDEAEAVLIHAMDKLSVKLSPGHPLVMTCKSEIARIMFNRGKYETAEQMNQAVLAAREQGPWLEPATHPDTMTSRNQLADVIRLKDGSKAADNLSERCLTERTVVLTNGTLSGDDFHPDQLASLHARAVVLSGLGQHLAALQKIDLALLGRRAILGEQHPDFFSSMTWKGEIMRAQLHRYQSERAQTLDTIENLHKVAYEGLSWLLGSEHPRSLQAATHMALAKRERGSPASSEAEGLFRQIHCAYQHNMGDFHPETLKAKGRLAEAMRAASPRHHLEAKKLWRDSCGGLTRVYGFDAHVTSNAFKGYEKFMKMYPDP